MTLMTFQPIMTHPSRRAEEQKLKLKVKICNFKSHSKNASIRTCMYMHRVFGFFSFLIVQFLVDIVGKQIHILIVQWLLVENC